MQFYNKNLVHYAVEISTLWSLSFRLSIFSPVLLTFIHVDAHFDQTLLCIICCAPPPPPPLSVGVVLTVLSTSNIMEPSTMTRELCVELTNIGEGLERDVLVDLQFLAEGYAREGRFTNLD